MKKFLVFDTVETGPVYLDVLSVCYVTQTSDTTTIVTSFGNSYELTHAEDTTESAVVRWYMSNIPSIVNNPYNEVVFTATPPPVTLESFSKSA